MVCLVEKREPPKIPELEVDNEIHDPLYKWERSTPLFEIRGIESLQLLPPICFVLQDADRCCLRNTKEGVYVFASDALARIFSETRIPNDFFEPCAPGFFPSAFNRDNLIKFLTDSGKFRYVIVISNFIEGKWSAWIVPLKEYH